MRILAVLSALALAVTCCRAVFHLPVAIELRLVGFADSNINLEELRRSLDVLATTDTDLFGSLRSAFVYNVRFYDDELQQLDWTVAVRGKKAPEPASADEIDQGIAEAHESIMGFVFYVFASKTERRAYASDPQGRLRCTTQAWISTRDRFAWIDLAAVLPESTFGSINHKAEGLVAFGKTVPLVSDMQKSSFEHRLASIIHRGALQLVLPTPASNQPFLSTLKQAVSTLRIMVIASTTAAAERMKTRFERSVLAPLKPILEESAMDAILVTQTFDSCAMCAAAHEILYDVDVVSSASISTELELICNVLSKSALTVWKDDAGSGAPNFDVFVLEASSGPITLSTDGDLTAKCGLNAIIGLETVSEDIILPTDSICNEQKLEVNAADASRQVLASILLNVFGVVPTYSTNQRGTLPGRKRAEYLFSVGHTPFGYFSAWASAPLAQSLIDTALRNPLIWQISNALDQMNRLQRDFSSLDFYGKQGVITMLDEVESALKRSLTFLGLYDFPHARTLTTEAYALLEKVQQEYNALEFVERCTMPADEEEEDTDAILFNFRNRLTAKRNGKGISDDDAEQERIYVPLLLFVFMLCAVLYETRVTKIRTLLREGRLGRSIAIGGPVNAQFVAPAKKID